MLFSLDLLPLSLREAIPYVLLPLICCAAALLCARAVQRGYGRAVKVLVILLVLVFLAANWLGRYPDWDELEHLHASWLLAQGVVPFRGFFEHHSPLLWLLLAPLVKQLPHTGVICDFARLLSLLISGITWGLAGLLARRVHGPVRGLAYVMALLGVCACGVGEFNVLRPDLPANALTLGALLLLLSPRLRWRTLLSGLLLGLAIALTPKYYYFLGLLPLYYFSDMVQWLRHCGAARSRPCGATRATPSRGDKRPPSRHAWSARALRETLTSLAPLPALCMHYLGVALGLLPLALWLSAHHLMPDFLYWVVAFNRLFPVSFGGNYPLLFVLIFGVWLVRVRADQWSSATPETRLLAIGTLFGAAMLFTYTVKYVYNAEMFLLLASVAGASEVCHFFARSVAGHYVWLGGVLLGFALMSYPPLLRSLELHDYLDGRREVAMLNRVCGAGTVVGAPPRHPICALDASDLNQPWQWYQFMSRFPTVRDRLLAIDRQIYAQRPVLIFCGEALATGNLPDPLTPDDHDGFVQHLWSARVLDTARAARLQAYIDQHYQLIKFVRHYYWVRDDRVTPDLPAPYRGAPAGAGVGERTITAGALNAYYILSSKRGVLSDGE